MASGKTGANAPQASQLLRPASKSASVRQERKGLSAGHCQAGQAFIARSAIRSNNARLAPSRA